MGLIGIVLTILSQNIFAMEKDTEIIDTIYAFVTLQQEIRIYGQKKIDLEKTVEFQQTEIENKSNNILYRKNLFDDALNKHELDLLMEDQLISYQEDLHDFEITKKTDLTEVIFLEDYTEIFSTKHGTVETKGKDRKNYIKFERINGNWVISEHTIYEFIVQDRKEETEQLDQKTFLELRNRIYLLFPQLNTQKYNIFRPVNKYKPLKIEQQILIEAQTITDYKAEINDLTEALSTTVWLWNGNSAAAYSDQYAINYNNSYRAYSNDCTNFASQCLKAGGKIEINNGDRTRYDSWYYGLFTFTTSYTWAGAHNLAVHLYNYTNTNCFPSSIYEYDKGDLLFADWESDAHGDHTMIIRKVIYDPNKPNGYVNYHSTNTYNKSVLQIVIENPNAIFLAAIIGNRYGQVIHP